MAKPHTSAPAAPTNDAVPATVVPPVVATAAVLPDAVLPDASGERTPEARTAYDEAMAAALVAASQRLSPPLPGPAPVPLPPVQPWGSKSTVVPERPAVVGDAFDRRTSIDQLLTHPSADVRQRAEEAQVAIHHGAADMGIKVRAAIDTARGAESRR